LVEEGENLAPEWPGGTADHGRDQEHMNETRCRKRLAAARSPAPSARETTAPIGIERPMLIETKKNKTCVANPTT